MASSYSDMIAKLIFVNISHLMMQPEVEASLARLRFIITHPRNFNQFLVPLFMTFIDIIVTFFAEWITLVVIMDTERVLDIMSNWSTIYIIS